MQYADDLSIRAAGVHFLFQLLGSKELGQFAFGGQLLVLAYKQGDEIFLAGNLLSGSLGHRLVELLVWLVVSQCLYYIGHRHFENDVHTALQVEAQSNLHFTALLQCICPEPHFLVLH